MSALSTRPPSDPFTRNLPTVSSDVFLCTKDLQSRKGILTQDAHPGTSLSCRFLQCINMPLNLPKLAPFIGRRTSTNDLGNPQYGKMYWHTIHQNRVK